MDTITILLPENYAQLLERVTVAMNQHIGAFSEHKNNQKSSSVASSALMIGLEEMAKTWSVK